jgi:hypothetical protein
LLVVDRPLPDAWSDELLDGSHLTYEQIEAYVDGTLQLTELATVRTHLAGCALCQGDVDEVRRFALAMDVQRPRRDGFAAAVRAKLGAWGWRPMAVATAAAAVVALLVVPVARQSGWRPGSSVQSGPADGDMALADNGTALHLRTDGSLASPAGFSEVERQAIAGAVRGATNPGSAPPLQLSNREFAGDGSRWADALARAQSQRPSAHLVLGALYQQRGMWAEAAREYRALTDANPQSPLARQLWLQADALARDRR